MPNIMWDFLNDCDLRLIQIRVDDKEASIHARADRSAAWETRSTTNPTEIAELRDTFEGLWSLLLGEHDAPEHRADIHFGRATCSYCTQDGLRKSIILYEPGMSSFCELTRRR